MTWFTFASIIYGAGAAAFYLLIGDDMNVNRIALVVISIFWLPLTILYAALCLIEDLVESMRRPREDRIEY